MQKTKILNSCHLCYFRPSVFISDSTMVRPTGQGRPVPPGGQTKTENPGFSLPDGPGRPGWRGLGGSERFRAAPDGFRPSVLISKMMTLAGRGRPEPPVAARFEL